MFKYCYVDFNISPYYNENINGFTNPTEYCKIGHRNNAGEWLFPATSYSIEYKFDKESLDFFNPVSYVVERSNKSFYIARFSGIVYDTSYSFCDTRYQGLGETGRFLAKKSDIDIRKIDKKKFIEYLKESTNVKRQE